MRLVVVALGCALFVGSAGCESKEEREAKRAAEQKAFMEAEAKAQAARAEAEAKVALDEATSGCASGDAEACMKLAKIHVDKAEAAFANAAFAKACAAKSKAGCKEAADRESDGKTKLEYLKKLCALDDADACLQGAALADELVKAGQLTEAPNPHARDSIRLLKMACDKGSPIACTAHGLAMTQGERPDERESFRAFTKGCELDEPTSCLRLSEMVAAGKGQGKKGAKDPAKAKELRQKACDAGLKDAC